ncbi:MAG TPA: hypothetical protein VMB72_05380, partial [Acidimicrobiales bacterium]|nr:hypothetical protein [Acidimicrobiales bacterium]
GDATDGPGFLAAVRRAAGFDPAGRRCVVLGAGGAARAVVLALAQGGAAEVAVLNRTPARAEVAAALAGGVGRVGSAADVGRADLVVQATPVGMAALGPATLADLGVDLDALGPGQVAADLVYVPAETPFLAAARARGATPVGGLGMLVHQAALALGHWTGLEVDPGPLWDAARAVLGPDAGPGG